MADKFLHCVVLSYFREGERMTGRVRVQALGGTWLHEDPFEKLQFRRMMLLFAERLQQYPEATALFERTDGGRSTHLFLNETDAAMLRKDPLRVIKSMEVEPVEPLTQTTVIDGSSPLIDTRTLPLTTQEKKS